MTLNLKKNRYKLELLEDDVLWFRETHPDGSLSGVIMMLFSKYREVNTYTPKDYAALAVKELMEMEK